MMICLKATSIFFFASLIPFSWAQTKVSCSNTFSKVSAATFVTSLAPGYNVGNTLDAYPDEGDWGPALQQSTVQNVKNAGFSGLRIPVTYAYHFTSGSPSWTVDPVWLARVNTVVDWALDLGFYTIVNVHHDSFLWADVTASGANYTMIEEKFYRLWYQIGTELACKSSKLGFEPINEPPGTTIEHAAELNKLNSIFLQAINDAGGFNSQRVVTLVGLGEDPVKTSQWFEPPSSNFSNPWAIQYHYYSPYDFIFSAWGKTTWGSDADKAALDADFASIRGNFTDIPLLIGEWSASPDNTETSARWRYWDFLVKTAKKYNTSYMLWDWSYHFHTPTWIDPTAVNILIKAAGGAVNSLPDSTTDPSATSQNSSAYIYHKAGTTVQDLSQSFILNGNTVQSIRSSTSSSTLARNTDYTVSGNNIIFKASYLSRIFNATSPSGVLANLTIHFSAGAELQVQAVQWDVPIISITSYSASANTNSALSIPITWKGIPRLAAMKAMESDGTYLVDSWTQYLGVLQQGRTTYNSQFSWDASNVIIESSVFQAVVAAGKNTTLTLEFYPRVPGNSVDLTVTV